eukprot:639870-Pleurochrysis_carterae.AAC.1
MAVVRLDLPRRETREAREERVCMQAHDGPTRRRKIKSSISRIQRLSNSSANRSSTCSRDGEGTCSHYSTCTT